MKPIDNNNNTAQVADRRCIERTLRKTSKLHLLHGCYNNVTEKKFLKLKPSFTFLRKSKPVPPLNKGSQLYCWSSKERRKDQLIQNKNFFFARTAHGLSNILDLFPRFRVLLRKRKMADQIYQISQLFRATRMFVDKSAILCVLVCIHTTIFIYMYLYITVGMDPFRFKGCDRVS